MRVFLCWSGDVSLKVASALYDFLGDVIQEIKPFLSSETIRKGDRWRSEIAEQLSEADFGILCLAEDNLQAPWILFEAGALSKNLLKGGVTALLCGIKPADVVEPLSQFQHTRADRDDIFRLVKELNQRLPKERQLTAERLERQFAKHWVDLEAKLVDALKAKSKGAAPTRRVDDMVMEVLELVRSLKRDLEPAQPGFLPPWVSLASLQEPNTLNSVPLAQFIHQYTEKPQRYARRLQELRGLLDVPPDSDPEGPKGKPDP